MGETGTIVWSELMTEDVGKAKDFYGTTLGVGFETFSAGDSGYWIAMAAGRPAWGIMDMTTMPGGPTGWFTYMEVDDVDSRVKNALARGAELLRPLFDVPTVGRIAILTDPTGALIGWMQPEAKG